MVIEILVFCCVVLHCTLYKMGGLYKRFFEIWFARILLQWDEQRANSYKAEDTNSDSCVLDRIFWTHSNRFELIKYIFKLHQPIKWSATQKRIWLVNGSIKSTMIQMWIYIKKSFMYEIRVGICCFFISIYYALFLIVNLTKNHN
jgi:hypothetical protein